MVNMSIFAIRVMSGNDGPVFFAHNGVNIFLNLLFAAIPVVAFAVGLVRVSQHQADGASLLHDGGKLFAPRAVIAIGDADHNVFAI